MTRFCTLVAASCLTLLLVKSGQTAVLNGWSFQEQKLERSERAVDMTTMLIGAAKAFILGGGVESLRGSPDKLGALQQFVQNYAVRSALGDGLVGQVLGRGLWGKQTTPAPNSVSGVLSKLMGNKNTDNTTPSSSDNGDKPGFFSRLFGRGTTTTTTTTTTPSPAENASWLATLAKKFLG